MNKFPNWFVSQDQMFFSTNPVPWQLPILKELFLISENPLYAIRAFLWATLLGEEIPKVVLHYFQCVSYNLLKIDFGRLSVKSRPTRILEAMGLSKETAGRGSFWEKASCFERDRKIAIYTYLAIQDGIPQTHALDFAKKNFAASKSVCYRAYEKLTEIWNAVALRAVKNNEDWIEEALIYLEDVSDVEFPFLENPQGADDVDYDFFELSILLGRMEFFKNNKTNHKQSTGLDGLDPNQP